MSQEAPTADVAVIVRETVLSDMERFGAVDVEVKAVPDHDGDPSLAVDIHYDGHGDPIDPKAMASLLFKLRERLWEHGETRFPYIRHHFPEAQKVVGFSRKYFGLYAYSLILSKPNEFSPRQI